MRAGRDRVRPGTPQAASAVAVPALTALALLCGRLGTPALWLDEAVTAQDAGQPLGGLLGLLRAHDASVGPYYLAVHAWVVLGGLGETWLRLPSALAMAAAVAVTADLARRWWGPVAGLTAGLLLALAPVATRYGQEARPYAFAVLFAVLALWSLDRAGRDGRRRWWAAYAGSVALLGLAHLVGLLVLVGHVPLVWRSRARPAGLWRPWCGWAAAGLVPAAALGLLAVRQRAQVSWIPPVTPGRVWQEGYVDVAGGPALLALLGGIAVLGLVAGTVLRGRRPGRLEVALLVWWLLPPLLLAAAGTVTPLFTGRYLVVCLPPLVLLAASAVSRVGAGARVRVPAVLAAGVAGGVVVGVVAGALLLAAPQLGALREVDGHGPDTRSAGRVISAGCRPGDGVWQTIATRVSLPYYLRGTGCALREVAGAGDAAGGTGRVWALQPSWQTQRPPPAAWGMVERRRVEVAGLRIGLFTAR